MKSFVSAKDVMFYMFDQMERIKKEDEHIVAVYAYKDFIVELLKHFLDLGYISFEFCELGFSDEYDNAYILTLADYDNDHNFTLTINKGYGVTGDKYLASDGFVLVHKEIPKQVVTDLKTNEYVDVIGIEYFDIGEDESEDLYPEDIYSDEEVTTDDMHGFSIHKTDANGYCAYSFYTSETISDDVRAELVSQILKAL